MDCGPKFPFLLPNVSPLFYKAPQLPLLVMETVQLFDLRCEIKGKRWGEREEEEEEGVGRKELKYITKLSTFKIAILTAINKIIKKHKWIWWKNFVENKKNNIFDVV